MRRRSPSYARRCGRTHLRAITRKSSPLCLPNAAAEHALRYFRRGKHRTAHWPDSWKPVYRSHADGCARGAPRVSAKGGLSPRTSARKAWARDRSPLPGTGRGVVVAREIPGSITLSPSTPTKRWGLRLSITASTAANQWPTKSVSIDPPPSEIAYNRVILTLTR